MPVLPPLHLGGLHPYEQALVALVAFGPFVVLIVVVMVLRRRDVAAEQEESDARDEGPAAPAEPSSRGGAGS